MGKHVTPFSYPDQISSGRFALNGGTPHPGALRSLAMGNNFVAQRMRKMVASAHAYGSSGNGLLGAAGTTRHWYFPFRSGVNASKLGYLIGIGKYDDGAATDPRVRVGLVNASTKTYSYSNYYRYKKIVTGSFTEYRHIYWAQGAMDIPAAETLYAVVPELEDYATVRCFVAWEKAPDVADDTATGVCDPTAFEEGRFIQDADVQGLLAAQTKLWQANGRMLASWTQPESADAVAVSGTTWTNILDSTTSVTSTSVGCTLLTQYNDTRSGNVPCEIAVYQDRTAGTGDLEVRFQSSSGTLCSATFTGDSTFTLLSSATTFVANSAETKYDIQMRTSDGSTSYNVAAVSLWEYEA